MEELQVALQIGRPDIIAQDPITVNTIKEFNYQCEWATNVAKVGVYAPKPRGAPAVFQTRPTSPLMTEMLKSMIDNQVICEKECRHAFRCFLIPKENGKALFIMDLSPWTDYYEVLKINLFNAAECIATIPDWMVAIKIDMKHGFYQLKLRQDCVKNFGIYYDKKRYCLKRLPMGLALAPYVLQRWAEEVKRKIEGKFQYLFIPYLDDWLILFNKWEINDNTVENVVKFLENDMGIQINLDKCILQPKTKLVYLGLKINLQEMTFQVKDSMRKRIVNYLKMFPRVSQKDVERFAGLLSWIFFVLRLPFFLVKDIFQRDLEWLQFIFKKGKLVTKESKTRFVGLRNNCI